MNAIEAPVIVNLSGTAEVPAGSIDLGGYPRLTYAPSQWGEGIRIASNGALVDDVALVASGALLTETIQRVADDLGLTWEELFDALRYARDQKTAWGLADALRQERDQLLA